MDRGGHNAHIIKRGGRRPTEAFERQKLHDSLLAALLSSRTAPGQAETVARKVTDDVIDWLADHPEVTSQDIRRVAARTLKIHHPDAAYLYEQHRITL
jgi:transcriptional regulator NrdR family protein